MNAVMFASSNPHKLSEVREIFASSGTTIDGLDVLVLSLPEPVEDGETFATNARIKALYYARATGRSCLADDSGLEVDALNGAPGVRSARYAGMSCRREDLDRANNERLLAALSSVPPGLRSARFVCSMCLADPNGTVLAETQGVLAGVIGNEPRGSHGFGYDPLFVVPDLGKSVAELSSHEKHTRSPRGAATRAMLGYIYVYMGKLADDVARRLGAVRLV